MNFYKVKQYTLTKAGEMFLKENPDVPWGCERIPDQAVDDYLRESYDHYFEKAGTTRTLKRKDGDIEISNIHGGVLVDGVKIGYDEWKLKMLDRQTDHDPINIFPNPEFITGITRGYQKDSLFWDALTKEDADWESVHWATEGYYTHTRLVNRCMALDVLPDSDADKFYVYNPELKRLEKTEPWEGFGGNTISMMKSSLVYDFYPQWLLTQTNGST